MLRYFVSKRSEKSVDEIAKRINSITKRMQYENEVQNYEVEQGTSKRGVGSISIEIFDKKIEGTMKYEIGKKICVVSVESNAIKQLRFGYSIKEHRNGSQITQFVEFDMGSFFKNVFVKVLHGRKIKHHMKKELNNIITQRPDKPKNHTNIESI